MFLKVVICYNMIKYIKKHNAENYFKKLTFDWKMHNINHYLSTLFIKYVQSERF